MLAEETGKRLHDRASRGESLTDEEQAQLAAWYAVQDAAESEMLRQPEVEVDVEVLQRQVDAASAQLMTVAERIQQVVAENNLLRQEIARLQQQLASRKQPA